MSEFFGLLLAMNILFTSLTRFVALSLLTVSCYAQPQNQRSPLPNWSVYDAMQGGPVVRLQPQIRYGAVEPPTSNTLPAQAVEPFLLDVMVVDPTLLNTAARIVAGPENHVLLGTGDTIYARGALGAGQKFRVLRQATPIKDPANKTVLGYETQTLGMAELISAASAEENSTTPHVLKIISAQHEIQRGDRLVPVSNENLRSYTPHPGPATLQGQVVAIHGNAVRHATENQIVILNRGTLDGVEAGQVFGVFQTGLTRQDKTDAEKTVLQLPDVQQGAVMVFRAFEKLSYALVLQTTDSVKVGDRFAYAK